MEIQDDRHYRMVQGADESVITLRQIANRSLTRQIQIPSVATFVPLVEDAINEKTPNWNVGDNISSAQFFTMVGL